jgi:hypothetical protein
MKNKLPEICYWCGISVGGAKEREHVPPVGFFPKGHREKMMTVPACKDHNSALSSLDEEFQLYIKSVAQSDISVSDFKDRTVRALKRKEAKGFVEHLRNNTFYTNIDGERTPIIRVNGPALAKFFEKVIRGLYFYHNERPAVGVVQGVSPLFPTADYDIADFCNNISVELRAVGMTRGEYFNPQIFQYEYINIPEHGSFLVVMHFYETVQVIGWVWPAIGYSTKVVSSC